MKLADAPGGAKMIESERAAATKGRDVFLANCAICHSSKQPKGFKLSFSREWQAKPAAWPELTLPMDFGDWEHFKKSPAYERYVAKQSLTTRNSPGDKFLKDNFLSNEIRVPVTLVGTNSGRAMATNAMSGQVWDNFSSDTYKNLPSVGAVHFYNPYSGKSTDAWGNNDAYDPPKGGPGYYRPASLISLWATAPYFHNNLLGIYNHKPSVEGRLEAFDDGIDKLLSKSKRQAKHSADDPAARTTRGSSIALPQATWISFPAKFIRPLIEGIVGSFVLCVAFWIAVAVVIVLGVAAWRSQPRHAGFALTLIAVLAGVTLLVTRLDKVYWALWLVPAIAAIGGLWFWLGKSADSRPASSWCCSSSSASPG